MLENLLQDALEGTESTQALLEVLELLLTDWSAGELEATQFRRYAGAILSQTVPLAESTANALNVYSRRLLE